MSIRAVVGVGPRVGTAFVMRKLEAAGIPVFYEEEIDEFLPPEGNPDGYYETSRPKLRDVSGAVVKVWPPDLINLDVERMIVLRRDRGAQLKSIKQQMRREGTDERITGDWLIAACNEALIDNDIQAMEVSTEDLDDEIDNIIEFMRY